MKKCFGLLMAVTIFTLSAGYLTGSQKEEVDAGYAAEIKTWQQKRLEGLKDKNGWLSLAGLFWLEEGKNNFGSDKGNDLEIKEVKARRISARFFRKG